MSQVYLKRMLILGMGVLVIVEFTKMLVLLEGNLVADRGEFFNEKEHESEMKRRDSGNLEDTDGLMRQLSRREVEREADGKVGSKETDEEQDIILLKKLFSNNKEIDSLEVGKNHETARHEIQGQEGKLNQTGVAQKLPQRMETDEVNERSEKRDLEFLQGILSEDGKSTPLKRVPETIKHAFPIDGDDLIPINTSRPMLNPHRFRYLLNSPDMCKNGDVFLLCYVHTAVSHYNRRKRIRQTWGNQANYPSAQIRVVFFVGLPQLNTSKGRLHQEFLEYEWKRYGDIVQEDFLDTYHNLSYKGVGALKWVTLYCNHTSYVLKTDDDMFINMYVILNHLQILHTANYRRRLILCYVFWKMHVDRTGGQWSLPKEYFPGDLYPPYCSGMGWLVSKDVAIAMYRVSEYVPFLWVDDAFISGVLPAALQGEVNHTTWGRTYCAAFEMGVYVHPTEWYKYTFSHVHNETLNLMTWKGLSEIVRNRSIPRPSKIQPGHLADDYIPLSELFSPPG